MYDVQRGFALAKDVHARGLQWTVTGACSVWVCLWGGGVGEWGGGGGGGGMQGA